MKMADRKVDDDDDICTDGASAFTLGDIVETPTSEKHLTQDNTATDESLLTITISKTEFDNLKHELKVKDRKLLALHNIHLLLQEKYSEILSLKEKNRLQGDALMSSEMRCSQLIRLMAKSAKQTDKQNPSKTHSDGEETYVMNTNVKLSKPTGEISNLSQACDQDLAKQSEDSPERISKQMKQKTSDVKCSGEVGLETDEASFDDHHSLADIKASEITTDMNKSTNESTTFLVENFRKDRSVDDQSVASKLHEPPVKVSFKVPGFSKDLVSKLMHQNARLKQVLRQVMSRQGVTMDEYLDRQEYISIVEQLRKEIQLLQMRIKDKDELLTSVENSDVTGLTAKYLKLQETIQKQNRLLAVKEAMVDAYGSRCEELEMELKQLKTGLKFDAETMHEIRVSKIADGVDSFAQELLQCQPSSHVSESAFDGNMDCRREQRPSMGETHSQNNMIIGNGATITENRSSLTTCERCEREFNAAEMDKFLEHLRKCTDD